MLNNYKYFIALAEEKSISHAADKLYISHQCLSKYLKNLEQEYNVAFFERTPKLTLTPAGHAMLDTLRQVQFLEQNLDNQLEDICLSKKGRIRVGTTEGRYRVLIPELISEFKALYPEVLLDVEYAVSKELTDRVLKNELDLVLINQDGVDHHQLISKPLLNEQLYLVISDNMLAQYFPDNYPACKEQFAKGVDLAMFQKVPFILNRKTFNSRIALENYAQARNLQLNCVMELTQLDIHFMMSARDYAASICWTMYLPSIAEMNQLHPEHHLNVFPIAGLDARNQFSLVTLKEKILPDYGKNFIRLVQRKCASFADLNPSTI